MNRRMYFSIGLTAGALILGGSLASAQSNSETKKAPATAATTTPSSNTERQDQFPKASGARVDQFGHASGKQTVNTAPATSATNANPADAKLLDSAHAAESAQKKHIAGVKYEDRAASTTGATPGVAASKIAIDEPGTPGGPKPTTNEMAIKETGISSSKPAAKPHQ